MEKQTTPTPWRVATKDEFYLAASDYNSVVAGKGYGGDGFTLTGWINKNDAELIVKAVNSHDKLVGVLKKLICSAEIILDPLDEEEITQPVYEGLDKDIKQARLILKHLESNPLK